MDMKSHATEEERGKIRYKVVRKDLYLWLVKNWRWKPPAEQRNNSIVVRRKRRKPTNFRTPYSFPRLWDEERRSQ